MAYCAYMKLTREQRETTQKGFINLYCKAYDIRSDVEELLLILVCTDKWIKKRGDTIKWNISRLSNFDPDFQLELVKTAISGEYQGLVFPNSKDQEFIFLKRKHGVTKNERLARILTVSTTFGHK